MRKCAKRWGRRGKAGFCGFWADVRESWSKPEQKPAGLYELVVWRPSVLFLSRCSANPIILTHISPNTRKCASGSTGHRFARMGKMSSKLSGLVRNWTRNRTEVRHDRAFHLLANHKAKAVWKAHIMAKIIS